MAIYSKIVIERFLHPRNLGKIKNPDGVGSTENIRCGDIMKIYIKVKKNKIKEIKFETLGCSAAIASSDLICDLAKGKSLAEAKKIGYQDIAKKLGKLPLVKMHCTHLAERALKIAIEDYLKKKR